MTCQPLGLPQEDPPRRSYQTAKDITWRGGFWQYTNPNAGLLPERGNCEVHEDAARPNQIRH